MIFLDDEEQPDEAPQTLAMAPPVIRTLGRGLAVLERVAESPAGVGVSEVARDLRLDKGTTSRLLSTLKVLGYLVQRESDRQYLLTGKLLRLSQGFTKNLDLRDVARPHLERLREEVNETVHLGVVDGAYVVYIDQLEVDRPVRATSIVGLSRPLHFTAIGRSILAAVPQDEFENLLQASLDDDSFDDLIVDLQELPKTLALARESGWATVRRDDEVTRVGCAIVDSAGSVIGAIGVSGPTYRTGGEIQHIGDSALATAARISRDLGADI